MIGGEIGDSRNGESNAFGIGGDRFGVGGGMNNVDLPIKGMSQGRDDWESMDQDITNIGDNKGNMGQIGDAGQGPGQIGIHVRGIPQAGGWKLDGPGQGQQFGGASGGLLPVQSDSSGSSQSQQSSSSSQPSTKEVQYGLGGLIDVIKMSDKDLSALALGVDLLTLGLNLNSQDCLYSYFNSPFADQPSDMQHQFVTPQCYLMHPPSFKPDHLSKYQLETLFYMFFTAPRDIKQAVAAQELYRREWRYHGELMIWLKPRGQQELMLGHPDVPFQYFDVATWEARLFTNNSRGNIADGLLSVEAVQVKPSQQQSGQQQQS
jgi:hypothetical protein